MTWIEILPAHFLGEIAEPLRHIAYQRVERAARLGDQHAFVGQLEAARSAPAQSDAKLGLEPLESEAEGRLLSPERAPGAADPAGLGDLVERLQEIPIDIAGEVRTETKHGRTPLRTGVGAREQTSRQFNTDFADFAKTLQGEGRMISALFGLASALGPWRGGFHGALQRPGARRAAELCRGAAHRRAGHDDLAPCHGHGARLVADWLRHRRCSTASPWR